MTPSNEPTKALMPCPFCGEPEPNPEAYTNEYWVRCPKCDATCATCYSEICARDKWNTRAPLPGVTMGGEVESRAVGTEWQRTRKAFTELTQAIADCKRHGGDGNWRVLVSAVDEMQESCQAYRDAMAAALSLATKRQSAEVREVSEEDVERACNQWCDYINNVVHRPRHDFNQRAIPDDKMRSCMRSTLVAYERGRK